MSNRNISELQFGKQSAGAMAKTAHHGAMAYLHSGMQTFEGNKGEGRNRSVIKNNQQAENTHSRAQFSTRKRAATTKEEKVRAPKDSTMMRANASRN